MRLRASLDDLRLLATPPIVRRGAWTAATALVERAAVPLVAWTFVQRSLRAQVATTLLFGVVFTARTLAQRISATTTECELLERTAVSVLEGDVLEVSVVSDEDLRLQAAQAVYITSQLLARSLPSLAGDVVACGLLAVALARIEPGRLVVFAAAVTLVAAAALLVSRRAVGQATERAWKVQERVYEAFGDALDGRLEIVAAGLRGPFLGDLRERTRAWSRAGASVAVAGILSSRLALAAVVVLVAAALLVDSSLRGALAATLPDIAIFASVTPAFVGVAQGVQALARDGRWPHLLAQTVRAALPRPVGASTAPTLPAPILFDRVSFGYGGPDGARDALSQVTLPWKPGEVLALSGSNGSGKSTLLRLLLGIAHPTAGAVLVNGVALAAVDIDAWRAQVAFLPQRPYLPQRADLRAAVRWPAFDFDDARILRALERVGLLAVLEREGRDPLSSRVDALSVGQRQRVALARLLCRDASMFLLDEPDANLDRAGIALVAELVRELAGRGMVAFAAHTPELLEAADRVVVLKDGRHGKDRL